MAEQRRRQGAGEHPADGYEPDGNGAAADAGLPAADAEEIASLREEIAAAREQLEQERAKAEANYANWQRATADFINFKRRTEQDREENARFANTALVLNVLPAVDDLERALQHVDPALDDSVWMEGIRQILRKLKGALAAAGVTEIAAVGEPFDPNLHEAIAEDEGEEGKVVSEAQRGYRLGNRVIRPSMVVVGRGSHGDR
ncbi:MAG TPA: nucleotide exchange factor GrpE [Dehalococcoidia bacterium]|nr:nucleotide exchange factor GrpE [Dehalococcoidia bacterium]